MRDFYSAETKAWRIQYLRYEVTNGRWSLETELYPNRKHALKVITELEMAPDKYQNISLRRITGDDK